MSQEAHKK